jgi:hypothetical protein
VLERPAPKACGSSHLREGPTKEQVIHVFGKPGIAWTWVVRAKAVGMKSAEEVARRFPELLKKPAKSSLVAENEAK